MKRRTLQVALHARESSIVELTVGDRVQLDQVVRSPHGTVAERHGRLLDPGTTTLALAEGHYLFRTLSDASLKVIRGGVDTSTGADAKDDPPEHLLTGSGDPAPATMGDEPTGELPSFTVDPA